MSVASTLCMLGQCVREAGRPGEAEVFFKLALDIGEAKLGPNELFTAACLHWPGLFKRRDGQGKRGWFSSERWRSRGRVGRLLCQKMVKCALWRTGGREMKRAFCRVEVFGLKILLGGSCGNLETHLLEVVRRTLSSLHVV